MVASGRLRACAYHYLQQRRYPSSTEHQIRKGEPMGALVEGLVGTAAIVGALALTITLTGLPRGVGLAFRLLLIAAWFWWRGWEALFGLIVLELIAGGAFLTDAIAETIAECKRRHRQSPPPPADKPAE